MTKLLIDGDTVLYTSSVATEFACDWGGGNYVLSSNLYQSQDIAKRYLEELVETLDASELVLCISGEGNFRHRLSPTYKGNRGSRKPLCYYPLMEWMQDTYKTERWDDMEADDIMGILSTREPGKTIIVSPDKDMQTIPGRLYRKGELVTITEEEANRFHMLQTLTGDATDGYSGCPGVGPKTAEKALAGPPEGHWEAILKAYEKAGLTADDALLNARLAYILRDQNYTNGEIKLWTPPSSK